MLIGLYFLYLSYYGCDQSQVQRQLSSRDVDDARLSLFLNGYILELPGRGTRRPTLRNLERHRGNGDLHTRLCAQ